MPIDAAGAVDAMFEARQMRRGRMADVMDPGTAPARVVALYTLAALGVLFLLHRYFKGHVI